MFGILFVISVCSSRPVLYRMSDDLVILELEKAGYLQTYVASDHDPDSAPELVLLERGEVPWVRGVERGSKDGRKVIMFDKGLIRRKLKGSRTVLNYLDDFGYLDAAVNQNGGADKQIELIYDGSVQYRGNDMWDNVNAEMSSIVMINITAIEVALKLFQNMNGLPENGAVDTDVLDLMRIPRCGVPDIEPNYFSRPYRIPGPDVGETDTRETDTGVLRYEKRYITSDEKWNKANLTYWIENTASSMTESQIQAEIIRAFQVWTKHIPLDIYQVSEKTVADIRISFVDSYHGDKYPFDGPMGVLAHAFYPPSGEVHFDNEEQFTSYSELGVNLYYTAAHEFGHSLGLKHSLNRDSLMSPYHPGLQDTINLPEDDIVGITYLYGYGSGTVYSLDDPRSQELEVALLQSGAHGVKLDSNCISKIDAVVRDPDTNVLYFFTGDVYYRVEQGKVAAGYPKYIATEWDNLPGDIDAAFTNMTTGEAYFFVGLYYWKYDFALEKMSAGFPREIPAALPRNLDALMSSADVTYVFGEEHEVWEFDTTGGADNLTLIKDKTFSVDAAFPLFVKGYFATTHNNTYSIYRIRNMTAVKVYRGRPLAWDYGLPLCYEYPADAYDSEATHRMGLVCQAYAMLASEDIDLNIPSDCYKLLTKFPVKPLPPI